MKGKKVKMELPEREICAEYRQAKNKTAEIGILAELNATDKKTICEVLTRNGEKLPGNFGPRKTAKPGPAEEGCVRQEDPETVSLTDALPFIIQAAAIETITKFKNDKYTPENAPEIMGRIRGVLALTDEVIRRCRES